jgi:hypothetical protein
MHNLKYPKTYAIVKSNHLQIRFAGGFSVYGHITGVLMDGIW